MSVLCVLFVGVDIPLSLEDTQVRREKRAKIGRNQAATKILDEACRAPGTFGCESRLHGLSWLLTCGWG